MGAEQILARIERVCRLGGDVFVAAGDRLNVEHGYQARLTLPAPDAPEGFVSYLGGGDSPREALADVFTRAQL